MFVLIYQQVFSADTFVSCPADEVVLDGKWEIAGTIVHLGHAFKIMMGLNTNPNLQLQVLILYLSKPMNQTAQFEDSPFKYKIKKWFKLSPQILGIWIGINIQTSLVKGLKCTAMSEPRSDHRLGLLLENKSWKMPLHCCLTSTQ